MTDYRASHKQTGIVAVADAAFLTMLFLLVVTGLLAGTTLTWLHLFSHPFIVILALSVFWANPENYPPLVFLIAGGFFTLGDAAILVARLFLSPGFSISALLNFGFDVFFLIVSAGYLISATLWKNGSKTM